MQVEWEWREQIDWDCQSDPWRVTRMLEEMAGLIFHFCISAKMKDISTYLYGTPSWPIISPPILAKKLSCHFVESDIPCTFQVIVSLYLMDNGWIMQMKMLQYCNFQAMPCHVSMVIIWQLMHSDCMGFTHAFNHEDGNGIELCIAIKLWATVMKTNCPLLHMHKFPHASVNRKLPLPLPHCTQPCVLCPFSSA